MKQKCRINNTKDSVVVMGRQKRSSKLACFQGILNSPFCLAILIASFISISCFAQLKAQSTTDNVVVTERITSDMVISANNQITAENAIDGSVTVKYLAGDKIVLTKGFSTADNTVFVAMAGISFTATNGISDAYVDLQWKVLKRHMTLPGDGSGNVSVKIVSDNKTVYETSIPVQTIIDNGELQGTYKDVIGDAKTKEYKLEMSLVETGGLVLEEAIPATGSTSELKLPELEVSSSDPNTIQADKIVIYITDKSDLINEYKIYRRSGDNLIDLGTIPSTQTEFEEAFTFVSAESYDPAPGSILNGQKYTYVVVPYSDKFGQEHAGLDITGETYDINTRIRETDNGALVIEWDDVSQMADRIRVTKNGSVLFGGYLSKDETHFIDPGPAVETDKYAVVLMRKNSPNVASYVIISLVGADQPSKGIVAQEKKNVSETGFSELLQENNKGLSDISVFPNPFSNETKIVYSVPTDGAKVSLKVFDISGHLISDLVDQQAHKAGRYEKKFNSAELKSGTYFCVKIVGDQVENKKMIIQK